MLDKILNLIEQTKKQANFDYRYYFGVCGTQGHDLKVIVSDTCEEIFYELYDHNYIKYEDIEHYKEQEGLNNEQQLQEKDYEDFLFYYYQGHYYTAMSEEE